MSNQVMAHGATATEKLRRTLGGFTGVNMVPPLTKLTGVVAAPSGAGKSTFLQSIPDAFIINVDTSSTVVRNPPCTIWPGIDPRDGAPIVACEPGEPGAYKSDILNAYVRRFTLTFEEILKMRNLIVEGYKEGSTFPACVVFDSLDMLIPLIKAYVIRKRGKETWEDFKGQQGSAAWADVYDSFMDVFRSLKQCGCGVIVALQITDKFTTIDEETQRKVFQEGVPSISDAFAGRLLPMCEWRGVITASTEQRETRKPVLDPLNGNKPRIDPATKQPITVPVFEPVKVCTLNFESTDPRVMKFTKGRQGIEGSIRLPKDGGAWSLLDEMYRRNLGV